MKKLTKIMALVLCLVMVFALCACGDSGEKQDTEQKEVKKTDTELLVGNWKAEIDMTDVVVDSFAAEIGDEEVMSYFDFGKIMTELTFTFNEDGTYKMTMELSNKTVKAFNTALEEGVRAYMEDIIAAQIEAYGMTMEEFEAEYLEETGVTVADDIDANIEELMAEFDIEELLADSSIEGNWKVENGKLYMTEDVDDDFEDGTYDVYEDLTEESFKIVAEYNDGEEDTESGVYPIAFTKVG